MRRLGRHRPRGFSLIETIAAVAIYSIAIVGLIQGVSSALAHWRLAEDKTRALMLAENVMEEIIYNNDIETTEDGAQFDPPHQRFAWSSVVEETEIDDLVRIDVSVSWSSKSHQRQVALTTLLVDRGFEEQEGTGGER